MRKAVSEWITYRTRFLVNAKRLTEPLIFVDVLGREHSGSTGDYLVESSDGTRRIAPREIFEDIYVPMGPACDKRPAPAHGKSCSPAPPGQVTTVENRQVSSASQPLRA